jgi:hypothetical protein
MTGMSEKQLIREFDARLAARKKWYDRKGEIPPHKAVALVYAVLFGVPLLALIISPWTGAIFRWFFG